MGFIGSCFCEKVGKAYATETDNLSFHEIYISRGCQISPG